MRTLRELKPGTLVGEEAGGALVLLKRCRFVPPFRLKRSLRLRHPRIAAVLGVVDVAGVAHVASEYVSGRPLGRTDDPIAVLRQIALGLEALHRGGIVHGNLHPGNVILEEGGTVRIVDFAEPKAPPSGYVTPEGLRGHAPTRRSDIFAFGRLAYELLAGRSPFAAERPSDAIASVLYAEPLPLEPRNDHWVRRCLAKRPGARFRSMASVRRALERGRPPVRIPARAAWAAGLAVVAGLLLTVVRHRPEWRAAADEVSRLYDADEFTEAAKELDRARRRFGDKPVYDKLAGHLRCASGEIGECVAAYDRAIDGDAAMAKDAQLQRNVVDLLGERLHRAALVKLVARMPEKMDDDLFAGTRSEDYWRRWNSVHALQERGKTKQVDFVAVYGLDLLHAEGCSTRRMAADRLSEIGDKRALEVLRMAADNACVGERVAHAIATLERAG